MKSENQQNPLAVLTGEQLSAVIFIQDYLQLDFDGQRMTFCKWPIVHVRKATYSYSDSAYRDVLCSLMSDSVEFASVEEGLAIRIMFRTGNRVDISLSGEVAHGEYAMFVNSDGEYSFF